MIYVHTTVIIIYTQLDLVAVTALALEWVSPEKNVCFNSLYRMNFKDAVKSVLRNDSAHNKAGPADKNPAQISRLSNFFLIKTSRL